MILETERLMLRNFIPEDASDLYTLNNDWEVMKFTGDHKFTSEEEVRNFIINYRNDIYAKWGYGRMMCIRKDINESIGWCGLKFHPDADLVDLGFRLHQKFWGQGFATEAGNACLKYGHEVLKIDHVIARAMEENVSSHKVIAKLGFTYAESEREGAFIWQVYERNLPL